MSFSNIPMSLNSIWDTLNLIQTLFRMRALQHYLYEEDLKAGDTGEAAIIAAKNEELEHIQNIKVCLIESLTYYLSSLLVIVDQ